MIISVSHPRFRPRPPEPDRRGGNWSTAGNWTAGVPTSATDAFIDRNAGLNKSILVNVLASTKDLTVDLTDQVDITNGNRLSIHGNVFNNGLILVNSTVNQT